MTDTALASPEEKVIPETTTTFRAVVIDDGERVLEEDYPTQAARLLGVAETLLGNHDEVTSEDIDEALGIDGYAALLAQRMLPETVVEDAEIEDTLRVLADQYQDSGIDVFLSEETSPTVPEVLYTGDVHLLLITDEDGDLFHASLHVNEDRLAQFLIASVRSGGWFDSALDDTATLQDGIAELDENGFDVQMETTGFVRVE